MSVSRTPTEARPPRMEALARLPVFFALAHKRAVIAGGTAAAAWKAELLSAAGADVDVYADNPVDEMRALAAKPPLGAVVLHLRRWQPQDFARAAIAVGAFEAEEEAGIFASAARAAGVPVNVVDKPAYCDFSFGSIVNRSPLVIGISTDGAAPAVAQAIRAKLEALIPLGFARWAAAENGSVTLVGAGPGDPELLTLRAVRALQSADVILIDDLVAPGVLDFARREAKKMLVGKTGAKPSCKQDEINALMVSLARAGRRVVRLKSGDPMVFGRAGEEIAACRKAGIAVEVVPGISAAQGAASRLGLSLTHRKLARRLQYVTAHAANGRLPSDIDWTSLADPSTTTVVYMPKRTLAELCATAIGRGVAPDMPAIAVAAATWPEQKIIAGTIEDIAARLSGAAIEGPVVVMIGRALAEHCAEMDRAGESPREAQKQRAS